MTWPTAIRLMFSKGLVKPKSLTTPRVKTIDLGILFTMTWDTHMEKLCETAGQILEVRGKS
jgi:hypothetical protein